MTSRHHRLGLSIGLAHAMLADHRQPGGSAPAALLARSCVCLACGDKPPPWLASLAKAVAVRWQRHGTIDTLDSLAHYLAQRPEWDETGPGEDEPSDDPDLSDDLTGMAVADRTDRPPSTWPVRRWLLRPAQTASPAMGLPSVDRPDLPTEDEWAAWLGLNPQRLRWLTHPAVDWREDLDRPHRRIAPHYRHILLPKRSGGLRLLEVPRPDLRQAQRRLLDGWLASIPAHEAAHGFVRGRNVHSFAQVHAGQACVIRFDLRDFFPSLGAPHIRAFWRRWGYPEAVAQMLTRLCTTTTPAMVRERLHEASPMEAVALMRLARPHLPQGAPTSPALANLCAFGLDLRLDGLAHRFGARYARYADDLVFSGSQSLYREARALQAWVQAIANDEGFALNAAKQRQMRAHQQQRITGLVVNQRPNLPREDYDRLRAELHRASRSGTVDPAAQARLQGQVAWACQSLAPTRVAKLQALLARLGPT
jgi:RNA-directed DNA polymerase